ncbi:hypothetical protein IGI77_000911 [Enterococcus sp. DIV0213h]
MHKNESNQIDHEFSCLDRVIVEVSQKNAYEFILMILKTF